MFIIICKKWLLERRHTFHGYQNAIVHTIMKDGLIGSRNMNKNLSIYWIQMFPVIKCISKFTYTKKNVLLFLLYKVLVRFSKNSYQGDKSVKKNWYLESICNEKIPCSEKIYQNNFLIMLSCLQSFIFQKKSLTS